MEQVSIDDEEMIQKAVEKMKAEGCTPNQVQASVAQMR
jgi:hypothetical protein